MLSWADNNNSPRYNVLISIILLFEFEIFCEFRLSTTFNYCLIIWIKSIFFLTLTATSSHQIPTYNTKISHLFHSSFTTTQLASTYAFSSPIWIYNVDEKVMFVVDVTSIYALKCNSYHIHWVSSRIGRYTYWARIGLNRITIYKLCIKL